MSGGGAIYDFDMLRFGGPTVPQEIAADVGMVPVRILTADPDRLAIYMTNNNVPTVYWSTRPQTAGYLGFAIGNGIVTVFQVQNDGALCGQDIWAVCPSGTVGISILTLRRQRRG